MRSIRSLLVFLIPIIYARLAPAQLVTFEAHGHMTESLASDFQVGDTFVADFTFDPTIAADSQIIPGLDAQYLDIVSWRVKFDRGYVFGSIADSFNPFVGVIEVAFNNTAIGYPSATDRYIATLDAVNSIGLPLPSGHDLNFIQIDLIDSLPTGSPDLLASAAVPTVPPLLALASSVSGRVDYDESGIPDQPFFAVDSFEAVPEPSAIALLTLGALGLLSARRRFAASM